MAAPSYHSDARSVDDVLQSTLKLHRHVNSNVNPASTPNNTTGLSHPFQYQQHQSPEPRLRHGSSGEVMAIRPVVGPGPSVGSPSVSGATGSTIPLLKKQPSQQQPLSQPQPPPFLPSSLPQQPQVGLGLGLVLLGQGPSSQGADGPSANGGGVMSGIGAGAETGTASTSVSAAMARSLSSSSWSQGPPASPRSGTVSSGMFSNNPTKIPSPRIPGAASVMFVSDTPSSPSSSPSSPVLTMFPSPSIARQPSTGQFVPLRDNPPQPQQTSLVTVVAETLGSPLDDQTQPQPSASLSPTSETIKVQREHARETVTTAATTDVGHQGSSASSIIVASSSSSAGKTLLTANSSTLPPPPPPLPLQPPQSMPALGPSRHALHQAQSLQQPVTTGAGIRSIKTSLGSSRAGLDEILRARQASQTPTITVWVRYVAKDLWVSVEIPREMPVNKARDLVLTKCQLTTTTIMTTPSAPASLAGSVPVEEEGPALTCTTTTKAVADNSTVTPSGAVAASGTTKEAATEAEIEAVIASVEVTQSGQDKGDSSSSCGGTQTVATTVSLVPSCSDDPSFEERPYPLATVSPPVSSSSASNIPVNHSASSSSAGSSQNKIGINTKTNKAASFDESQLQQQSSRKNQSRSAPKKPTRSGQGSTAAGNTGNYGAEKESGRLFKTNGGTGDRRSSETSLEDEDEDRKRRAAMLQAAAEAVATRWDIFSDGLNGYGEEASRSNYERIGKTGIPARGPSSGNNGKNRHEGEGSSRQGHDLGPQQSTTTKKAQQLKRLLSNSSMHNDDGTTGQSNAPGGSSQDQQQANGGTQDRNNSISKEGGRLGSMSSWYPWRDRDLNHSHVSKQSPLERELAGYLGEALIIDGLDGSSSNFATTEEATAERERSWRALFGLFWRSAGHWLDDSRPMSSYTIKSNDVLELQLRSHFIPLPPITSPDYFNRYAEGILFKLSKKSRPKSMLTGHTSHGGGAGTHGLGGNGGGSISSASSKESMGVWKERWVVLQGTKLLIYHKRKDTAKKTIEISLPVQVSTCVLPPNTRHMFKFTTSSSSSSMSSTMLSLDVSSELSVPKVYFRGASEHDITQWTRIFSSLGGGNVDGYNGMKSPGLVGLSGLLVGSPTPGSHGTASLDLATSSLAGGHNSMTGYTSERRRNHTAHSIFPPTSNGSSAPKMVYGINPVVISNVAAALSNFNSLNGTGASISNNGGQLQQLQQQSVAGQTLSSQKSLSGATREDIRRRAITEPNQFRLLSQQQPVPQLPQQYQPQSRGHAKHHSKVSAPELETAGVMSRSVDVSNVSEAPFRLDSPPGRKRKPVLGTEYLDNASQRLLVTSSARSSMMPMYSGYVWLYIPGMTEREDHNEEMATSHEHDVIDEKCSAEDIRRARVGSLKTRSEPEQGTSLLYNVSPDSPNSLRSIGLGASPSKHSQDGSWGRSKGKARGQAGRYVKCFVAINDQGHFQWVEVKKQAELDQQEQQQQRINGSPASTSSSSSSSSRSGYGFQLKTAPSGTMAQPMTFAKSEEKSSRNSSSRAENSMEATQAFQCHKLSLFFFCIRVPKAVISRAMVDMSSNQARPRPISPTFTRASTLGSSLVAPGLASAQPIPTSSGAGMISPGPHPLQALSPTSNSAINNTPTQVTPPPVAPKTSVATKARHRLSASLSSLATAALPPLPNFKSVISPSSSSATSPTAGVASPNPGFGTLSSKGSPQSSPGATATLSNKGPLTWPSFTTAQLQENRYSEKPPPPPLASAFSSPSHQPQSSNQLSTNSIQASTELTMNMSPRTTTVTHRGSLGSLRNGSGPAPGLLITTLPPSTLSMSPPPLSSSSSSSSIAMSGLRPVVRTGGNEDLAFVSPTSTGNISSPSTSSVTSPMITSAMVAPTTTPPTSAPTVTTPLSNVVSLAQSLQKAAMKSRKMSVSSNGSSNGGSQGTYGSLDGQQGVAIVVATNDERVQPLTLSETQQQQQAQEPWNMTSPKPRMTIFEATLAKNANIPDSAAMLEQNKIMMLQQQQQAQAPMMQLQKAAEIRDPSPSRVEKNLQDEGQRLARDCPFFGNLMGREDENNSENEDKTWVVLKGYTETEEEWKILQSALERFLDDPVSDSAIALPPEDTIIPVYNVPHPSYDCPPSERDKKLWSAVQEARNAAAAAAAASSGEEVNEWYSPSEQEEGGRKGSMSTGAVAQIRATSVSLTRWMNLSGSSSSSGHSSGTNGGEKEKSDRSKKTSGISHRQVHSSTSLQGGGTAMDQSLLGKGSNSNLSARHGSDTPDHAYGGSSNGVAVTVSFSGTSAISATSTPIPHSDALVGQPASSRSGPGPNAISIQTVKRVASPAPGASILAPRPRLSGQRSADGLSRATSPSAVAHPLPSFEGHSSRTVGPGPNHHESQSPVQEPIGPSQGLIYSASAAIDSEGAGDLNRNDPQRHRMLSSGGAEASSTGLDLNNMEDEDHFGKGLQQNLSGGSPWSPVPVSLHGLSHLNSRSTTTASGMEEISSDGRKKDHSSHIRFGPENEINSGEDFYGVGSTFNLRRNNVLDDYRAMSLSSSTRTQGSGSLAVNSQHLPGPRSMSLTAVTTMSPSMLAAQYHPFTSRSGDKEQRGVKDKEKESEKSSKSKEKQGRDASKQHNRRTSRSSMYSLSSPLSSTPPVILQESTPSPSGYVGSQDSNAVQSGIPLVTGMMTMTDEYGRLSRQPTPGHGQTEEVVVMTASSNKGSKGEPQKKSMFGAGKAAVSGVFGKFRKSVV